MSLSQVRRELKGFVRGDSNFGAGSGAALALQGRWGVGKTYLWHETVRSVKEREEGFPQRYAYVSLFGLNSLKDLRAALTAAVATDLAETASGQQMTGSAKGVASAIGGGTAKLLKSFTGLGEAVSSIAETLAYEVVRDALICIDDLERSGTDLKLRDVFGLVTQLREERGCNVCVILNDEQLQDEGEGYRRHGEKAIDIRLRLEPNSEEAFNIVFPQDIPRRSLLKKCCTDLEITNVRLLMRVRWTVRKLFPHLEGRPQSVVDDCLKAAVLFVWGYYAPEGESPDYNLLRRDNGIYLSLQNHEDLGEDQRKVVDLRSKYDYLVGRATDNVIADFVERGWIDEERFTKELDELDEKQYEKEREATLTKAWKLYHYSLEDNQREVVEAVSEALRENATYITLHNADASISLLRQLKHDDLADELAKVYAEENRSREQVLRWRKHAFEEVKDSELRNQIDRVASQEQTGRLFEEVLGKAVEENRYSPADIDFLAASPASDYEEFFRENGPRLRDRAVRWCLEHAGVGNEDFSKMARHAKEAVLRIAQDSHINKVRVQQRYGVEVS